MKVLILCALLAVSQAQLIYSPGLLGIGASTQFRSQDKIGNYAFGYNEGNGAGATFRKETGDAAGNKVGSYGLQGADGRMRVVDYVADAAGFRANIRTNEQGVDASKPAANTLINNAAPIIPAALTYAPALIPGVLGAPTTIVNGAGYSYSF